MTDQNPTLVRKITQNPLSTLVVVKVTETLQMHNFFANNAAIITIFTTIFHYYIGVKILLFE